ncbi:hypothetical protein DVB69_04040 [Sporosarcina sp. BI001-red]|uniref:hypothetical protein n=1 Tax=Sporosarcina sp. BI001-red TaxID=2282866 RepID=UPI000E2641D7|nr:hypothetical protein [Sporosarcina sp. BI001-red]REB09984.1 hypothetical protein DVB69_04040 [Sporosarcina sp. BI001-red]
MEQIIILIVIGLLSTLFSKKNKGGDQNQKQGTPQKTEMPQKQPMTERQPMAQRAQPSETRQASSSEHMDPFKRLKELTGEIYKEIQEDQRKTVAQQAAPVEPVSIPEAPVKKPVKPQSVRAERPANSRSSGRLSTHNPDQQRFVKSESLNVDVTSRQDILKGIVFSEILGPPKSKQ